MKRASGALATLTLTLTTPHTFWEACAMARPHLTASDRFWAKVDKNGPIHPVLETRCWIWTAAVDRNGYGRFGLHREGVGWRCVFAHRFAFENYVGPLPDGLGALHHCDNPPCVNYETHLFPGTQAQNNADAKSKGRAANLGGIANRRKTHCKRGHEYTAANAYWHQTGPARVWARDCRTCRQLASHARVFLYGGVYRIGSGIRPPA